MRERASFTSDTQDRDIRWRSGLQWEAHQQEKLRAKERVALEPDEETSVMQPVGVISIRASTRQRAVGSERR